MVVAAPAMPGGVSFVEETHPSFNEELYEKRHGIFDLESLMKSSAQDSSLGLISAEEAGDTNSPANTGTETLDKSAKEIGELIKKKERLLYRVTMMGAKKESDIRANERTGDAMLRNIGEVLRFENDNESALRYMGVDPDNLAGEENPHNAEIREAMFTPIQENDYMISKLKDEIKILEKALKSLTDMANGLLNWYKEKLTREGTDVSKYSDEQLVYSLGKRMEGEYGPQKIKEYPEFSQQYTSVVNAKQAKRLGRDGFFGGLKEIPAGLGQGIDETQGMLYGGGGYLAKKVGLDSASKWLMKQSLDNMRESQKNAPTIQSFSEVNSFGEGLRFLSGGLGRVIPSGATMIGTGGVGGLAGKQILKKAVVGPALRKKQSVPQKRI